MSESDKRISIPRKQRYLIIWSIIFGTALAFGGSVLEPFPIPGLNITAASFYVALMITLNKLVVFNRFSTTYMYLVAGTIAIFTTYLGPPTILKPLYVFAGFSFDLASFFRTKRLKFYNLVLGHFVVTIVGFFIFWIIFSIMVPGSSDAIAKAVLIASPFHFFVSVIVAYIVFKIAPPNDPPDVIKKIRSQMEV